MCVVAAVPEDELVDVIPAESEARILPRRFRFHPRCVSPASHPARAVVDFVHMYINNGCQIRCEAAMPRMKVPPRASPSQLEVERVQTGVKIEKRILKVLKAMAEYHDITLGDLLEGIVLHAFEGKPAFERASLERITQLKAVYGLDLDARHAHRLKEKGQP